MKEKEINEGNKLIAQFMGQKISNSGIGIKTPAGFDENFKYHTSWDALMPVVQTIAFFGKNDVQMKPGSCFISTKNTGISSPRSSNTTWIMATWWTVVKYIGWYNEQRKTESEI